MLNIPFKFVAVVLVGTAIILAVVMIAGIPLNLVM